MHMYCLCNKLCFSIQERIATSTRRLEIVLVRIIGRVFNLNVVAFVQHVWWVEGWAIADSRPAIFKTMALWSFGWKAGAAVFPASYFVYAVSWWWLSSEKSGDGWRHLSSWWQQLNSKDVSAATGPGTGPIWISTALRKDEGSWCCCECPLDKLLRLNSSTTKTLIQLSGIGNTKSFSKVYLWHVSSSQDDILLYRNLARRQPLWNSNPKADRVLREIKAPRTSSKKLSPLPHFQPLSNSTISTPGIRLGCQPYRIWLRHTPYGEYTAFGRTYLSRIHKFESPHQYGTVIATAIYGSRRLYG